jgi:hypothetical protein
MYFTILAYLGECYRVTLDACSRIKEAIKNNNNKYKEKCVKELREDLLWWPRQFAFRLIAKTPDRILVGQLAKDNKFTMLLNEVQKDFDKGCDVINNIRSDYNISKN